MSENLLIKNKQKESNYINHIASNYRDSIVLLVTVKEKLFSYLGKSELSAEQIAKKLQWNLRATAKLCNALIGLRLLEKKNGKYSNTQLAKDYLIKGKPFYQGNILEHNWHLIHRWIRLDEVLRTGKPIAEPRKRYQNNKELEAFILGMKDLAKQSAQALLKKIDFSNCRKMLDLGGGPATYSIAFTKAYPKLHATVLDLPNVIPIAKKEIKNNKATRVNTKIGNMLDGNYGKGYDVILLSSIIHSFGPEENQKIIRYCSESLIPGGMLIIKDFYCNEYRTAPHSSLLFAINMMLGTEKGDTYTISEVKYWMQSAGFIKITQESIDARSGILIGRKK